VLAWPHKKTPEGRAMNTASRLTSEPTGVVAMAETQYIPTATPSHLSMVRFEIKFKGEFPWPQRLPLEMPTERLCRLWS